MDIGKIPDLKTNITNQLGSVAQASKDFGKKIRNAIFSKSDQIKRELAHGDKELNKELKGQFEMLIKKNKWIEFINKNPNEVRKILQNPETATPTEKMAVRQLVKDFLEEDLLAKKAATEVKNKPVIEETNIPKTKPLPDPIAYTNERLEKRDEN